MEKQFLDLNASKLNVAVSANDIGAANIIFSIIDSHKHHNYFFNLSGQAKKQFEKKYNLKNSDLTEISNECDILICGTGWQSDHEYLARECFYNKGKYIVVVLDHWVNYKERFKKDKRKILADEIWVTDKKALKLATNELEFENIKLIKNYYLEEIVKRITNKKHLEKDSILYLSEPIREPSKIGKEFNYLKFFLSAVDFLGIGSKKIIFRLHPTESKKKYEDFINNLVKDVSFDSKKNVEDSIASAKYVFGIQSMALYTAVLANKITYTVLMEDDEDLVFPTDCITELRKNKIFLERFLKNDVESS